MTGPGKRLRWNGYNFAGSQQFHSLYATSVLLKKDFSVLFQVELLAKSSVEKNSIRDISHFTNFSRIIISRYFCLFWESCVFIKEVIVPRNCITVDANTTKIRVMRFFAWFFYGIVIKLTLTYKFHTFQSYKLLYQ